MGEFPASFWGWFTILGKAFSAGMGSALWFTDALSFGAWNIVWDINQMTDLIA